MTAPDTLWQSFANCSKAGLEVDALTTALHDLVADGALGALRIDVESEYSDDLETEQGWTCGYSLLSYKVIPARGRQALKGWVTFGVSFWRQEDERGTGWEGGTSAKLYVGFSPPKAGGWVVDNLVVDGSGQSLDAAPFTTRRWRGTDRGGMAEAWFFCVRLIELRNRTDLDREIATPLRLLLEGVSEDRAFAESVSLLPPPNRAI